MEGRKAEVPFPEHSSPMQGEMICLQAIVSGRRQKKMQAGRQDRPCAFVH